MAVGPIGLAFSAISGVMGAVGAMSQASAAKQQAEYQAAVARNNQIIAEQNARYSAQAGEVQSQAQGFKNRATLGAIEAAQGASGIQLGSPSLTDVRESAANVLRLDTANIMSNALLRSRGYNIQGQNFAAEGELAKMRGSAAQTAGFLGAAGSLLGGASSFAEKWSRLQAPTGTA